VLADYTLAWQSTNLRFHSDCSERLSSKQTCQPDRDSHHPCLQLWSCGSIPQKFLVSHILSNVMVLFMKYKINVTLEITMWHILYMVTN